MSTLKSLVHLMGGTAALAVCIGRGFLGRLRGSRNEKLVVKLGFELDWNRCDSPMTAKTQNRDAKAALPGTHPVNSSHKCAPENAETTSKNRKPPTPQRNT
ncbi:MAG: hypothetical protein ABR964_00050 [Tepidisphaeraceae bacterium]